MPEWHQLNSSSTMPTHQESTKKKTLKSSSRSFWFSTGLSVFVYTIQDFFSRLCSVSLYQLNDYSRLVNTYIFRSHFLFENLYLLATMESHNIKFKAVIKFLITADGNYKEIYRRMADMYGDSSPKCSTVLKWSDEFKRNVGETLQKMTQDQAPRL